MKETGPQSAQALLSLAAGVLDGSVRLARVAPARVACWLARRALESLVAELLRTRSLDLGDSSMRSRLICLSVAYGDRPGLVTDVSNLWDQLTRNCHHHAYELTPTVGEAQDMVSRLAAAARSASTTDL